MSKPRIPTSYRLVAFGVGQNRMQITHREDAIPPSRIASHVASLLARDSDGQRQHSSVAVYAQAAGEGWFLAEFRGGSDGHGRLIGDTGSGATSNARTITLPEGDA